MRVSCACEALGAQGQNISSRDVLCVFRVWLGVRQRSIGVTFQFYSLRRESFPIADRCVAVCSLLYQKLFFLPGVLLFVDPCVAWSVVCLETSMIKRYMLHGIHSYITYYTYTYT